ncbi:MAG: DUF190 domain-containing protein [Acidobacteriota bacterium]
MAMDGKAQQLWIFIGEKDRWQGKPLYLAILEALQRHGCAGATVFRGLAGFGANSLIHTVLLLELSTDLPIVITAVDREDRLQRVLPEICEMVQEGMVTLAPVEVVKYTHRVPGPFPPGLTVGEVMTREVVSVRPEAPVAEVLDKIIDRDLRAIPVVDGDGRVLGRINEEDLLIGAGLELPASLREEIATLGLGPSGQGAKTAAQVMRPGMASVNPETLIPEAAARMAEEGLKRLAVVDGSGRLIGILSRSDILKTVVDALDEAKASRRPRANLAAKVEDSMRPGDVSVGLDAPLAEVLDGILESRSRYVVVTDAEGRVAGIITEGDILERAGKKVRPEVMRAVGAWLRGGRVPSGLALAAKGRTASEVMSRPVVTVPRTAPVSEALKIMIERGIKLLPAVDEEGRLVGTLNRSALLAALARRGEVGGAGGPSA